MNSQETRTQALYKCSWSRRTPASQQHPHRKGLAGTRAQQRGVQRIELDKKRSQGKNFQVFKRMLLVTLDKQKKLEKKQQKSFLKLKTLPVTEVVPQEEVRGYRRE